MSIEGERSEWGDEGSFDHESLTLDELNQEWSELYPELQSQEEQHEVIYRQYIEKTELFEGLADAIDERNMVRLLDEDPDRETIRCLNFMEQSYGEHIAQSAWAKNESDEAKSINKHAYQGAVQCLQDYVVKNRQQRFVIESAIEIIYSTKNDFAVTWESTKRAVQAQLHILHGLPFADNWMQLFDDVTPGEGIISLSYIPDKPYIDAAYNLKPGFDDFCAYENQILETAIDLATYKKPLEFWNDIADVAQVLTTIAGLYQIAAAQYNDTYGAEARRNEQMWQYGRQTQMDNNTLHELIDYMELVMKEWGE